jgi:sugar phosphate permease
VLGAVALGNLVVAALHFGLAAAGPALRSALDLDTASLGVVLATPAIGLMLGTFAWGVLADATSERRVLTGAFVGFAASAWAAAAFADDGRPVAFGAALLASGLFGSAAHSAGGRAISAAFPVHRHGLVLSIRHVAIPVGAAIGGVLVPLLVRRHGLGPAMVEFAVAGLVAALLLALLVPSSRGAAARAAREQEGARGPSPLRVRSMWLLAAGAGSLAFVQLGIGSFLTVQLVDRTGMQLAAAAAVFTAAQLLGGAGRVVLGVWSDRVRERASVLVGVAAACVALVGASLGVPGATASALLQAAALVVVTSCNGVVVAVAASLAPPGRTGATLGMQTTANAAACAIAPILLGALLERSGWRSYEAVMTAVLVGSCAALLRLRVQGRGEARADG